MNSDDFARRTLNRLHALPMSERLRLFLNDPANVGTERYRRICELLDMARARRDADRSQR
jgi:hypothetical protein